MQVRVRKIGNGYGVLFPKQLLDGMVLEEGSVLNVEIVDGAIQMTPSDSQFTRQVEAFLKTEARHRDTYRELAK